MYSTDRDCSTVQTETVVQTGRGTDGGLRAGRRGTKDRPPGDDTDRGKRGATRQRTVTGRGAGEHRVQTASLQRSVGSDSSRRPSSTEERADYPGRGLAPSISSPSRHRCRPPPPPPRQRLRRRCRRQRRNKETQTLRGTSYIVTLRRVNLSATSSSFAYPPQC